MNGDVQEGLVNRVNALTQEQRDRAYENARQRMAGAHPQTAPEPQLADYQKHVISKYPRGVRILINVLIGFMLFGAFIPSAMRLHEIGKRSFAESIADASSVELAALCIVLMAENGQIIFSLAAVVNAQNRTQRTLMLSGALISTLIALSGNAVLNQAHAADNVFAFLETFAPPVLVLIAAQVLKMQMLHAVEERHAARTAFEAAHALWKAESAEAQRSWQNALDSAHEQAAWQPTLANAIRDAIRDANKVSKALLRELSPADWRALVIRERKAEEWWQEAEAQEIARTQAQEVQALAVEQTHDHATGKSAGVSTGEAVDSVRDNEDGTHTATCAYCGREFKKDSRSGATNALVAHYRRCEKRTVHIAAVPVVSSNGVSE